MQLPFAYCDLVVEVIFSSVGGVPRITKAFSALLFGMVLKSSGSSAT